jgi:glycosyltransferase involved in cell wall biosynthesis
VVVVPQGIDPGIYHQQARPEREELVTLIVAPVDERKHTRLAISAWKEAFDGDPHARLVIKTTYGYHNYVPDDPRITYVDRVETSRGIVGYYRDADVLLALGNEGFGLPLVEGMATGLPVIALDSEGQRDVCRDAGDLVLSVPAAGVEAHDSHVVGSAGMRSIPDRDTVVRRLRWVAEHRAEAREMGRQASEWAMDNRNIWSMGAGVLDVVGRTSARPRRTVPPRTLWIPSLGRACGIAETTERLHRNVPSVRLTAAEPTPGSQGLVHVQHEPSIIDARQLEHFVARARSRGRAVLVTEHSVFDRPEAWEQGASALVAATTAGAAVVRRRNPTVRVEMIPLGCETWTPVRKRERGRTIGFFGFPGSHKGLHRLAAAARRIPGSEVVLYAHHDGPAPPAVAQWPGDVALRWERAWLPMPELAARLAAETDLLALPYAPVAHHSASSAVLLALSTGVPVLTSDTTWFADLGAAVHRVGDGEDELADGLARLLDDDVLRRRVTDAAREHCADHSWSRIAARHVDLWNSMEPV